MLCDLIAACQNIREIDLSHNNLEDDQIDRVLHVIRNSPIVYTITAILLDGNKPGPTMTDNVMALVELAPQL